MAPALILSIWVLRAISILSNKLLDDELPEVDESDAPAKPRHWPSACDDPELCGALGICMGGGLCAQVWLVHSAAIDKVVRKIFITASLFYPVHQCIFNAFARLLRNVGWRVKTGANMTKAKRRSAQASALEWPIYQGTCQHGRCDAHLCARQNFYRIEQMIKPCSYRVRTVLCANFQGAKYADNLPANTCATSSQLACTPSDAMSTVRSPA